MTETPTEIVHEGGEQQRPYLESIQFDVAVPMRLTELDGVLQTLESQYDQADRIDHALVDRNTDTHQLELRVSVNKGNVGSPALQERFSLGKLPDISSSGK